jgi:hypothetical protein
MSRKSFYQKKNYSFVIVTARYLALAVAAYVFTIWPVATSFCFVDKEHAD